MWVSLVGLGVLAIFVLGMLIGEGFETEASKARRKRQAMREMKIHKWQREIDATLREINMMNRAPLDRVGELELVDLEAPIPLVHAAELVHNAEREGAAK
jgi:hypothetical protein